MSFRLFIFKLSSQKISCISSALHRIKFLSVYCVFTSRFVSKIHTHNILAYFADFWFVLLFFLFLFVFVFLYIVFYFCLVVVVVLLTDLFYFFT